MRQVLERTDRRSICQGDPELGSGSDWRAMHVVLLGVILISRGLILGVIW